MAETQHAKLLHKLTSIDRRAAKRPHHNPYALAHYCRALNNAQRHCDNGADLRVALLNCFNGRLLDHCLKAVGLETSTNEEQHIGGYPKLPELDDE